MNANTQRAIQTEQLHQQAKWGGRTHSVAEWLLILEKLTDDARRAWVTKDGDESALHEVRQIATTAIACLDQCGAPERALDSNYIAGAMDASAAIRLIQDPEGVRSLVWIHGIAGDREKAALAFLLDALGVGERGAFEYDLVSYRGLVEQVTTVNSPIAILGFHGAFNDAEAKKESVLRLSYNLEFRTGNIASLRDGEVLPVHKVTCPRIILCSRDLHRADHALMDRCVMVHIAFPSEELKITVTPPSR